MNDESLREITNAANRLERIEGLKVEFIDILSKNGGTERLPTNIEIEGEDIFVDCFGYRANAITKPIRIDGEFSIEYRFVVSLDDKPEIEVSRFYLEADGKLKAEPGAERKICDFNGIYTAGIVCGRVLMGSLNSDLFRPTGQAG